MSMVVRTQDSQIDSKCLLKLLSHFKQTKIRKAKLFCFGAIG